MRLVKLVGAAATLCMGGTAIAQDSYYWPASSTPAVTTQATYFPLGTPLTLRTRTQVSTKDNHPGDRVYLEVAEGLFYKGQVVIPAGAVAVAEVARADRNGHFGRKGKLDVRLLYVQTPSGPIRLSGSSYDEGTTGLYTSIATMALVSPLGFLVHGTSAHIPLGSTVQAYIAEPMRFYERPAEQQVTNWAQPDQARPLPARFDPSVFGGAGYKPASR